MKRCGEALSISILILSAALSWRLGFSLGASDVEKHILALISVALEGWKVLLPFVILSAWRNRRPLALLLSLILWPLLTAYSFVGGLGFAELNRAALAGTRGASVERAATLKTDIADLTERIAAITTKRAPPEIESAIHAREQTPVRVGNDTKLLVAATNRCIIIVSKKTVDLCAEIASLDQELAQARERVRLEGQLASAREQLSHLSGLDWEGVADPQIGAIANLTHVDKTTTRQIVNVIFAALLELIGGLGLFFSSLLARPATTGSEPLTRPVSPQLDTPPSDTAAIAPPETEESRIARYLAAATMEQKGSTIVASKLHADYSRWAHAQGSEPVSLTTFGNLIARLGIRKEKVEGLMHYQDLAFRSEAGKEAA